MAVEDGGGLNVIPMEVARDNARLTAGQRAVLARRVTGLLGERSMTGRGLAEKAGIGVSTVLKLLRAQTDPPLSTLLAIAYALQLSTLDELVAPGGIEVLKGVEQTAIRAS